MIQQTNTITVVQAWTAAFRKPGQRDKILVGSVIVLIILSALPLFFHHIQNRKGVILNDWVLSNIPSHNVSVIIFAIIWSMALLILYRAFYNPVIYINYIWTLIFINLARVITISIVALDPPRGLVNLTDPITGIFYGNVVITKDLFFSGHVSTLMLILLCLEKRSDKITAAVAVMIVAVLLLVQHIHYTVDVLAAPFVVYGLFRLTHYILKLD